MPIARSECLYFPDMVVDDVAPGVLARLVLCWDAIWTIVPEGMARPSKSRAERELSDLGLVRSLPVAPYSKAVRLAGDAVEKVFDHGDLKSVLHESEDGYTELYDQKLADTIRSSLHWGKLPCEFSETMGMSAGNRYWKVSQKFASAYMAVLAKYLADQRHLSLATEEQEPFDLSQIAALGRPAPRGDLSKNELLTPEHRIMYGECLLHHFILRDLKLDPDTPLSKLDSFRRRYPSEVSRYRAALQTWTQDDELLTALLHSDEGRLRDWYSSEVEVPLTEIKEALHGIGINCTLEQAVKVSAISTPASGLAIAAGAPPAVALGSQLLISFVSSVLKVREDRKKVLAGKPYAYLYRLERKFRRR